MPIPPIGAIGASTPAAPTSGIAPAGQSEKGGGFGGLLTDAMNKLDKTQTDAANAAQQLATGQSNDISAVAMDVEQASLSLQLAVQVRNKVVDAYNDLFRMQI
jgi:flagellar hook-basal body complex protein FliE